MHHPDAGVVAEQLEIVALGRPDQDGVLGQLRHLRHRVAIGRHDLERVPVRVDRVGNRAGVDQANEESFALCDADRRDRAVHSSVDQEEIGAQFAAAQHAIARSERLGAGRDAGGQLVVPLGQHEGVVAVVRLWPVAGGSTISAP